MAATTGETSFILFGTSCLQRLCLCVRALSAGWPLQGSWFLTASRRFASRSNPQRMSVAWVANHMRVACAWSSLCKLGSSIMTRTPPRATRRARDSRQRLATKRLSDTPNVSEVLASECPNRRDTQNLSLPSPGPNLSNTANQIASQAPPAARSAFFAI